MVLRYFRIRYWNKSGKSRMSRGGIIKAVYENEVLRPLRPLKLRERQTVRLQLLPEEAEEDEGDTAVRILVAAGLMRPPDRLLHLPTRSPKRNAVHWHSA